MLRGGGAEGRAILDNPPPCPNCGKRPWREKHLTTLQVRSPLDGEFCVCMHCSAIWFFEAGGWVKPRPEHADFVAKLRPYAVNFTINRALGIAPED